MKVTKQDLFDISSMAKTIMQHQPHRLYWDHAEVSHTDKVTMCYLKALNAIMGTEFAVDILKEQK